MPKTSAWDALYVLSHAVANICLHIDAGELDIEDELTVHFVEEGERTHLKIKCEAKKLEVILMTLS